MNDLPGFLLARITEDEAFARVGQRLQKSSAMQHPSDRVQDGTTALLQVLMDDPEAVEAIALYSKMGVPAPGEVTRTLADCAAKRRIISRHSRSESGECEGCGRSGELNMPRTDFDEHCPELVDLASVYADHPNYCEEWRP